MITFPAFKVEVLETIYGFPKRRTDARSLTGGIGTVTRPLSHDGLGIGHVFLYWLGMGVHKCGMSPKCCRSGPHMGIPNFVIERNFPRSH